MRNRGLRKMDSLFNLSPAKTRRTGDLVGRIAVLRVHFQRQQDAAPRWICYGVQSTVE